MFMFSHSGFHTRVSAVGNLKDRKKIKTTFPITHLCPGHFLPLGREWCYFNDLVINKAMEKSKQASYLILWQKLLIVPQYQFLPSSLVTEPSLSWVQDQPE